MRPRLRALVKELGALYGPLAAPAITPLELILLENASYLVDDDRRWRVFEMLRAKVGVTPEAILSHDAAALAVVIADGGMKASMRAEKLMECARVASEIGVEQLNEAVLRGSAEGKRLLQRFPGIGEPSADKIMLLCGGVACVAPDSNALRVLTRLGFATEQTSYARTYRMAVDAIQSEVRNTEDAIAAHLLLRKHGQELCKRTSPRCEMCPLRAMCVWYQTVSGR